MSKHVALYVSEVKEGRMNINDVPAGLRIKVEKSLSTEQETQENEVV